MAFHILLIALTVSLPQVQDVPVPKGNPSNWITQDDYPVAALRKRQQGTVRFSVRVDEKGLVSGCSIIGSSGFAVLDDAVCAHLARRGRFVPATDSTGKSVTSYWTSAFTWALPR